MRTQLLSWTDATPEDREELKRFACTQPAERTPTSPYKRVYARPHERAAEKLVHGLDPVKAARCHRRIWLGRDELGVGAVICWEWRSDGSLHVLVAALSNRLRGRGTRYTQEMVNTAQAQAMGEAVARGLTSVDVGAVIHRDNSASRYFAGRYEMEPLADVDARHKLYGITLDSADEV